MQITGVCLSSHAEQLPSQSTVATIEGVRVPIPCTIASKPLQSAGTVKCIAGVCVLVSSLVLCGHDSNFGVEANWHSRTQKRPVGHDDIDPT